MPVPRDIFPPLVVIDWGRRRLWVQPNLNSCNPTRQLSPDSDAACEWNVSQAPSLTDESLTVGCNHASLASCTLTFVESLLLRLHHGLALHCSAASSGGLAEFLLACIQQR